MKTCTRCGVTKPRSEFHKQGNGLRSMCKPCACAAKTEWYRDWKQRFWELKNKPCTDCGMKYPACAMQWDHRDPKIKNFNIGEARNIKWQKLLDEVAKCDLVCANCHAIRTHNCGGDHEQLDPSDEGSGV